MARHFSVAHNEISAMDIKDTLISALDEAPAVAPKGGWEKHNKQFHKGKMPTPEHCKFLQEHGGGASAPSASSETLEEVSDVDTVEVGNEEDPSSVVTAEEDAAYMDAVKRGDMETAQRMVREAAKERGYEVFGLHGTRGEFTVFDKKRIGTANDEGWLGRGFYFWDKGNRTYAEQYANGGKVMEVMLSMQEPYLIDKEEMERLIDAADRHDVEMLEDFSNEIKANGYDSVIDGDGQMLVFEPNQIKSADPVTYNDAGDVIPLSQRFNTANPDIRYAKSGKAEAGWSKRLRTMAQAAARMVERFMPGVKVRLSETPYEGGGDERKSISGVFTGSAADYNKPSLLKVGTGEGAQVYGWGLYGSTERGVAEGYAKDARKYNAEKNGKRIDLIFPKNMLEAETAKRLMENGGDVRKTIENLKRKGIGSAIIKELEEHGSEYSVPQHEHLYEQTFFTNRAAGDESHLLMWYDAISDANWDRVIAQAEKEGLRDKLKGAWWLRFNGDLENFITDNGNSGDAIYERLSKLLGSSKAASEFLARAGIDGIKYPVDSYGGKGVKDGDQAGWNYVSFRDDNIRVDHKWTNGELRYFKGAGGKVVGTYNRRTGEVVLYPGADKNTIAHELGGHATWQYAEQLAKDGDDRLLRKMNAVVDNAPRPIKKEVAKNYGKETDAVRREEVWAHVMGNRGSAAIQKALESKRGRTWWGRFWNIAKEAWRGLASKVGLNRVDLSNIEAMSPDEFADYMAKEMASGKVLGNIKYDNTDKGSADDTRKQFIGAKGASAMGLGTADKAQSLEAQGASREDIYAQTGWWKGTDGKWRIEVPDITLKEGAFSGTSYDHPETRPLTDIINEDAPIFKAYPELRKFKVYAPHPDKIERGTYGSYNGKRRITINAFCNDLYHNEEAQRATLAHELQHAVQYLENFAVGGNEKEFKPVNVPAMRRKAKKERRVGNTEAAERLEAEADMYEENALDGHVLVDNEDYDDPFEAYQSLTGEVEARNAEKRLSMSPEERMANPPWNTQDTDTARQITRFAEDKKQKGRDKSFIGWLGAYNLGGIAKLSEADRMAQKGASREDIWRKTGWYQGKDGKWRIELLDTTKKAPKPPVIRVLRNPRTGETEYGATLGSLVKNDKLFTAYPELAEVPVFLRKDMEGDNKAVTTLRRHKGMPKGFYTPIFITMKGDPDRLRFNLNDKQLGSLTHELQHAVQGLEGFENGTTSSVDKDYHRVVGEVEARNARRREQMTREERLAKPPWETEDVPEAEQKLIDHLQGQEAASVSNK